MKLSSINTNVAFTRATAALPGGRRARRPLSIARVFGGLLLCLALAAAGCSGGTPRGTVKGKVTLGDKPVGNATISFEGDTGAATQATVGEDGTYEIKTHQGAGLPVGNYKVAISPGATLQAGDEVPLAGKPLPPRKPPSTDIPEKFYKTATSGLKIEVKKGDNPPFDFDLSKPTP
jgi:hypothetical protein